jgi:hypothetical protein
MGMIDLVAIVKAYAVEHYNDGGWDVIVECWSDDQILEKIERHGATTRKQAIQAFVDVVDVWADRQADAINSAF